MLQTEKYSRKPFDVEAVQVTEENIDTVAKWCGGEVRSDNHKNRTVRYIYLEVNKVFSERQKKALIGDYVLKNGKSFKCYMAKAFRDCFEKSPEPDKNQDELPFEGPISDTEAGRELQKRFAAGRV